MHKICRIITKNSKGFYIFSAFCAYFFLVLSRPGLNVSLMGSSAPSSGKLVVNYSGMVGMVCEDGWSFSSANVTCRQLGYVGGAASHRTEPRSDSDPDWYWIQSVQCTGGESRLSDCSVMLLGSQNGCPSNTIASVTCAGMK